MERIAYKAGYKYQLVETYSIQTAFQPLASVLTEYLALTKDGYLTIKKGYAWDGPSGPTIDTLSAMRGSLIHDAGYQLIRLGYLSPEDQAVADQEYWRLCVEDGMSRFRAWAHFKALSAFGSIAAQPTAEKMVLHAP